LFFSVSVRVTVCALAGGTSAPHAQATHAIVIHGLIRRIGYLYPEKKINRKPAFRKEPRRFCRMLPTLKAVFD
jgi:hypothetical protein